MKIASPILCSALAVLAAATLVAQTGARPIPRIVEKDGRFALFVDGAPFLVMGIEDLTMGDWPPRPSVWPALEYMHGQYGRDPSLLAGFRTAARQVRLRGHRPAPRRRPQA